MSGSSVIGGIESALSDAWCGDATSVVEFLRPLRAQLDAPGVLEVCVNRPGEMLVETANGWQSVVAAELNEFVGPGAHRLLRKFLRSDLLHVLRRHNLAAGDLRS